MLRIHYKLLLVFIFLEICTSPASTIFAQLPAGFSSNLVQSGYTAPMGVVFANNGNSMFTWEKSGRVYVSKWSGTAYTKQSTVVLDIHEEVGDWRDFGLLSFCLDPDFDVNGLIYLYYVVDRHYLLNFGTGQYNPNTNDYFNASIGRVTRYRLNLGATITADLSSRKILLGESASTGIPLLHESHMGGCLIFGRDKTLLLTAGDGASYNVADVGSSSDTYYSQALAAGIIRSQENVGALRAQMVNSLSGKLLRFDPNTGDGLPSNPFYDASNPRSPKSRVWAMGFRNPFRMSFQPNTGSTNPSDGNPGAFLVGDVGWYTWEEIDVINAPGLNCGWPLFEGQIPNPDYSGTTVVNADEGQQFRNLCLQPTSFTLNATVANRRFTHYRPALAWKHDAADARVPWFNGSTPTDPLIGAAGSPTSGQPFAGNCAIGGVYYTGTAFGPAYQNSYFFGDYGTNIIKVTNMNAAQPWMTTVSNFAPSGFTKGIVDLEQNPLDNTVFYVNINTGEIMRISMGGNAPPVVSISSNPSFGGSPLQVSFSSAGTSDPDGGSLTYLWDFGDGTTSTLANPIHTFTSATTRSFNVTMTATDPTGLTASKSLTISINNTPPTVHINNPSNGSTYSILNATQVTLSASVTDNESTSGIQYAWEVVLRHNNHEHREPINTNPNPTVQISPVGCGAESYYYLIQLAVTDNGGLIGSDSVKIYPDCSAGGSAITNLTAVPQTTSVVLSWTNPTAPFDELMVAAQPNTGFLSNPSGTNFVADANYTGSGTAFEQGRIVYKGSGQGVTVTNLSPGTIYYFRVFTRIGTSWTGGVETSATLTSNLMGSGVLSTATVNLTTEGIADWAHWSGYDHKSSGGSKISNYTIVGTGTASTYNNDLRTCTWSDGTPTASGSNKNGIYITGTGKGFQITAPADLTMRTLKVYAGGWVSGGTLTASLSDASSPDYVNSSFSGSGQYDVVYTINYRAASAGKLLTVKWVQASGTGNVTFQGATLVVQSSSVPVTGVTVNPATASLQVGTTQQLTATITPSNATNQNVSWSSSNTGVCTVSSTGLVTATGAGSAIVTVTTQDGNKTAGCNVSVTSSTVSVTGVTVSPTSATLNVNQTQQLTATVNPANATNKTVSWSSNNTAVATVNASGLVTANAVGTATITVITQDGNKTATSAITVVSAGAGSLTGAVVSSTSTINLTTEGTEDWAHWPGFDHKASGGSKITNYTVVGTVAGSIYNNDLRTCSWSDGTPAASGSNANGLFISGTGNGFQLSAPADLSARTLKVYVGGWVSGGTLTAQLSDGSAASYTNSSLSGADQYDGVYILTYKAGSAGKSILVSWTQASGTGNVTLQAATLSVAGSVINVTGVTVNPTTLNLQTGTTQQLTATISPANATNQNVSWSSSSTAVCTVNASGLVSAVGAGNAVVTVTTQDGNKTATCNVAVTVQTIPVTGVSVSPVTATIGIGGTQQLTATVAPSNATNKNISWSSGNTAVATVSNSGLVTGAAAGTAIITVTTQDGNKTATSTITVAASQGSLTGAVVSGTATVNLTAEGSSDWAHWSGYAHKANGGTQISNFSIVGAGTGRSYTNDLRTCTWSDGTPTTSGSNKNGVYISGIGNGFQITAPADATARTLKVYIGGWISGGTLTAQLSDGSAANYVNSSLSGTGQYDGVYTISYKAAAPGKQLIVRWVQGSGTGNITLQGATLVVNTTLLRDEIRDPANTPVLAGNGLSIFPNPFYDNIILNYQGRETGKGTTRVYDAVMRLVAVYPFEKTTWSMRQEISTGHLSKGIYFIRFSLGKVNLVNRQVKME